MISPRIRFRLAVVLAWVGMEALILCHLLSASDIVTSYASHAMQQNVDRYM